MTDWIHVNTNKITRIGYNKKIKTLYIDFVESSYDIPYKDVSQEVFEEFSQSDNIDSYYDKSIKNTIQPTLLNTDSIIIFDKNMKV